MAHVYANRAAGRTTIGRRLDRRLLDRATCQAFRDIRGLAEAAVIEAIDAAGAARRRRRPRRRARARTCCTRSSGAPAPRRVLWDIDAGALEQASAAARELGVQDRVTTRRSSAFDRAALASLRPRPDVVCELGLYGIYHDDALIERHFADLAETRRAGADRLQRAGRQPRDRVHRARLAQRRGRALRLAPAPAGADRGLRARGRLRRRPP